MRVESPISRPRRISAWIVALGGLPALAYSLSHIRDHIGLSSVLLLFLAVVVTVAALGGTRPAVVAALIAFMLGNYYFTPPFHRLAISDRENVIALLVFLGVALIVSRFVDAAARSAADAERAGNEARTLADLAATILDDDPMPALLSHLRDAFGFEGVALLRRRDAGWECTAAAGEHYATDPGAADLTEPLSADEVLVITGRAVAPEEHLVLDAFATRLADAALLERVIANVAHNAARLSPPGMPVRITAEVVDDAVELCVIDRGPGIPIDKRHAIFEPFQRLGDSQRSPGVGLGLAVAQGFLRAMDATIAIEETTGGGTTMRMRFGIAS